MIQIEEKYKCNGCYACVSICPISGCIVMQKDAEGFWYPEINVTQCISCGACEKVCPVFSPIKTLEKEKSVAFAAINNSEDVRKDSSSGGIFTELAQYVIQEQGVVFGAAFDDEYSVRHQAVEQMADLKKLRGSKYVQSKIGNTYKEAEQFLKEGRLVLYSGTPCQIGGLLAYLKRPYDNLITQDIICHGVPSPMVWEKYVKYRRKKAKAKTINNIYFRNKIEGWKKYSVYFQFEGNKEYRKVHRNDPFMKVFLADLCLRPSCYKCSFKTKKRLSDITLADFWGVQEVFPEMDDDKGVSLVLVHSDKGKKLLNKLLPRLFVKDVDIDLAISHNPAMLYSAREPDGRKRFMTQIGDKDFKFIDKKYCQPKIKEKVKNILRKVKYKLFRRKK